MSVSKRSSSIKPQRGSCNEDYQPVWEVPGVAETIFVRYEPRSPPGTAHAHAKCSVHFVFLRGAGVLRHTDAEGRFHATEVDVSSGERWVAIDLDPGCYYQVDVSGSDTGLDVIMSLTLPYSAEHRHALSREENERRGWAFAFAPA